MMSMRVYPSTKATSHLDAPRSFVATQPHRQSCVSRGASTRGTDHNERGHASRAIATESDQGWSTPETSEPAPPAPPPPETNKPEKGPWADKLRGFRVAVAGANGQTGRCVVEALRINGVPVRAMVRSLDRAQNVSPSEGVVVVEADVFKFSTLPKALGDANALIICTGATDRLDPLGPFNVDFQGTLNLLALAKQKGYKKIVLVSSIGADTLINFLNLFWGVLFWKKRAEEAIQRSGIDYTIIRPGGLKNKVKDGEVPGSIVMEGPGYFGVPPAPPPQKTAGSILRTQVAEICIEALFEPAASNKVVEVVASPDAPRISIPDLFASVV